MIKEDLEFQWRIQDFPLGGADPLGGANLRGVHFSAKTYAKTKEIDPVGGARAGGAPPGSANELHTHHVPFVLCIQQNLLRLQI